MSNIYHITLVAHLESLSAFRDFLKENCTGWSGVTKGVLYDIQLAVDEACTNIITHGYANMDPGSIVLDLELNSDCLRVHLTDFGHCFEPGNISVPDVRAPIEQRKAGGYGLFFIKQLVDLMEYQVTENCNTMTMIKYLSVDRDAEHDTSGNT